MAEEITAVAEEQIEEVKEEKKYVVISAEDLDYLIKTAGEEGAKKGIEIYEKKRKEEEENNKGIEEVKSMLIERWEKEDEKEKIDEIVMDETKWILVHYNKLKKNKNTSVHNPENVQNATLKNILEGMANRVKNGDFVLSGIEKNIITTAMLLDHVDVQLNNYKKFCKKAKMPDVARRYRVVEMMYLREDTLRADDVAEIENIEKRSVYVTLERAYEDLAVLIFGVKGMEANRIKKIKRKEKRKKM